MLNYSNPYDVLSETISFENVQLMGEMIALKTLRGRYAYARYSLEWLYVDLVQVAVCFLCEFAGKQLTDDQRLKTVKKSTLNKPRMRW